MTWLEMFKVEADKFNAASRQIRKAVVHERKLARNAKWRKAHSDRIRAYMRAYVAGWFERHGTTAAEYMRAWRAAHPGKAAEYNRKYRQTHRDQYNAAKRAYYNRKQTAIEK